MSDDDQRTTNELIEEHAPGRRTTKALAEANLRYRGCDDTALADISANLRIHVVFYP